MNGRRQKAASSRCRSLHRRLSDLAIWGRLLVEFHTSLCPTPAGCLLAGVLLPPMAGNGIACASKPFLVAAKGLQVLGGIMLDTVPSWMAEGFKQSGRRQHGNVMRFETEKPSGLTNVQACREHFPSEKFVLLFDGIHIVGFLINERTPSGVCDTQNKSWFDSPFGTVDRKWHHSACCCDHAGRHIPGNQNANEIALINRTIIRLFTLFGLMRHLATCQSFVLATVVLASCAKDSRSHQESEFVRRHQQFQRDYCSTNIATVDEGLTTFRAWVSDSNNPCEELNRDLVIFSVDARLFLIKER